MTKIKWQLDSQRYLPASMQAHPSPSHHQSWRNIGTIETSLLLVNVLQQAYRHECHAARIYRALAERERAMARQRLLRALAVHAEKKALYYAYRLKRLNASIPIDNDGLGQRLWRWLLIRCGVKPALRWIARGKRRYRGLLTTLAYVRLEKLN